MSGRPRPLGGAIPLAGSALGVPVQRFDGAVYQYTPGTYTFRPPRAGFWKFVVRGAGGSNIGVAAEAASGALSIYTRYMDPSQTAAISCGGFVPASTGQASTVTFQDGKVVTAGGGASNGGLGGTASGGDINMNGVAGSAATGGAAPSYDTFLGGAGGGTGTSGRSPGGGAGPTGSGTSGTGGDGVVLVMFVRD